MLKRNWKMILKNYYLKYENILEENKYLKNKISYYEKGKYGSSNGCISCLNKNKLL